MKIKWLMVVFILITVVITFVIHENSSYTKAAKSDDKIFELIKSEFEKGKNAEEIKVCLEANKKALDIARIEISSYKDFNRPPREYKVLSIYSTIFSWKAFNEGRQGPMLIHFDEGKKIIEHSWAPM